MLNTTELKTNIKNSVSDAREINPVTGDADKTLENYCSAVIKTFTDNIKSNTKDRLNQLESDYNSLLIALTTLAAALSAIPITAAAGAALSAAMALQTTNAANRLIKKTEQDILSKPYIDGTVTL